MYKMYFEAVALKENSGRGNENFYKLYIFKQICLF